MNGMSLKKKKEETTSDELNREKEAVKQEKKKAGLMKTRGFKHGSVATLITICFIAGAVLLNVIASLLDERFPINIDLTNSGIYDLSDDTRDYIEGLDKSVDITVLLPENYTSSYETVQISLDVINLYPKYSNKISLQYVDTVSNPSFASNYPNTTLTYGDVIVECGDKLSVFSLNDTINLDDDGNPESTSAESSTTSSIMTVTSDVVTTVGVITGHDETELTGLTDLLTNNSFTLTKDVTIGMDAIDSSLDMLLICTPVRDYSDEELKVLSDYLDNGGQFGKSIVYIADPSQPALPNLNAFLNEWGIEVKTGTVYENNTSYILSTSDPRYTAASIEDTDYTADYTGSSVPFFAPYSTPLGALFTEKDNRKVTTLASFSSQSAILPVDATSVSSSDEAGPFSAIIAGQKIRYDQLTPIYSTVLVFSSSQIFSYTAYPNLINAELTAGIMNNLAGRDSYVNITSKEPMGETITVSATTAKTVQVIFQYLLPIAMLVTGVAVWLRRRHL